LVGFDVTPEGQKGGFWVRKHTFMDQAFRRPDYDPDDPGEFIHGLVFVIMSFTWSSSNETYSVIKDECAKIGLRAKRVDEEGGSAFVISDITRLIEDAEFIVCDLSEERPNVYYELGYAHGVGNESDDILLVAREGTQLHFDIAPLRVQYYSSLEQLRRILSDQLQRMIQVTRDR
jgi:hypothetical protein